MATHNELIGLLECFVERIHTCDLIRVKLKAGGETLLFIAPATEEMLRALPPGTDPAAAFQPLALLVTNEMVAGLIEAPVGAEVHKIIEAISSEPQLPRGEA